MLKWQRPERDVEPNAASRLQQQNSRLHRELRGVRNARAVPRSEGISHRRNINLTRAGLIIVTDEIGGPTANTSSSSFWHTGVDVRMLTPSCFALRSRARLHLQPGTSRDWEVGGELGWRSLAYGVKEASPVVRVSNTGSLPMKLVAVIDLDGKFEDWPL